MIAALAGDVDVVAAALLGLREEEVRGAIES